MNKAQRFQKHRDAFVFASAEHIFDHFWSYFTVVEQQQLYLIKVSPNEGRKQ